MFDCPNNFSIFLIEDLQYVVAFFYSDFDVE